MALNRAPFPLYPRVSGMVVVMFEWEKGLPLRRQIYLELSWVWGWGGEPGVSPSLIQCLQAEV